MNYSPIVLFVYNRPNHTLRTLEALAKNELSDKSVLYIYADGEEENTSHANKLNIKNVREIIRSQKWCGEVNIIEKTENNGIGNMEVDGITEIIKKYGKIIVLEDDIITSKGFLKFMNDALNKYENEERVMHVSGYMFPIKKKLPQTFFFNSTSCWGWGTWYRAWKNFNNDSTQLLDKISKANTLNKFTINNTAKYDQLLKKNAEIESLPNASIKEIRKSKNWNWDVSWYASVYVKNGLCLHPAISMVKNIGHDNTGIHCRNGWWAKKYTHQKTTDSISVTDIPLEESFIARNEVEIFYRSLGKPPALIRVKEKVKLIFK